MRVRPDMIGLKKGPNPPHRKPPQTDPTYASGEVADAFGLMLERVRIVVPVASAFTGIAYLRKLAGHRRRIRREELKLAARLELVRSTNLNAMEMCRKRTGNSPRDLNLGTSIMEGLRYGDLKIVNCAGCRSTLLGESQEPIRERLAHTRRAIQRLPPKIAGRLFDRPYCAACLSALHPIKLMEAK